MKSPGDISVATYEVLDKKHILNDTQILNNTAT